MLADKRRRIVGLQAKLLPLVTVVYSGDSPALWAAVRLGALPGGRPGRRSLVVAAPRRWPVAELACPSAGGRRSTPRGGRGTACGRLRCESHELPGLHAWVRTVKLIAGEAACVSHPACVAGHLCRLVQGSCDQLPPYVRGTRMLHRRSSPSGTRPVLSCM